MLFMTQIVDQKRMRRRIVPETPELFVLPAVMQASAATKDCAREGCRIVVAVETATNQSRTWPCPTL
jgi:hypothetical protein